jgi:pantoate--beta-alanine ligase
MIIFKTASEISAFLSSNQGKKPATGFVPTLVALHLGHLSLVEEARKQNDRVVCSIFINPTQFNNQQDFQLYPVTIEKDIELLIRSGCDVLFLPSVNEIYPAAHAKKQYPLGELENLLEGAFRPGHFQGVCEVVERLLDIVQPDKLYLGQKDFQQCMVIAKLLSLENKFSNISLHIVPTMREPDGLAMSSRNLRLTPADREKAIAIHQALQQISEHLHNRNFAELEAEAERQLAAKGFDVDYVAIRDRQTLSAPQGGRKMVALAAAAISGIRLIDNLLLDENSVN